MSENEMLKSILYQVMFVRFSMTSLFKSLYGEEAAENTINKLNDITDNVWNQIWEEVENNEVQVNQTNE